MIGVKTKDTHFEQGLREIKAYIAQHGTIQDLSRDYRAPSGFALGAFVYLEIYNYKNCNPRMAQRIEPLQKAGLDWEQAANWEYRMHLIIQAYQEQGKLPEKLIYRGENLIDWFQEQVRLYETDIDKLGYSQVKMLSMVGGCPGLTLDEYRERRWDMLCAQMQQYRKADGTPDLEKLERNESLEKWYKKQLKAFRDDKLTPRRAKKLAAVGMTKKYMLHTVEEKHILLFLGIVLSGTGAVSGKIPECQCTERLCLQIRHEAWKMAVCTEIPDALRKTGSGESRKAGQHWRSADRRRRTVLEKEVSCLQGLLSAAP